MYSLFLIFFFFLYCCWITELAENADFGTSEIKHIWHIHAFTSFNPKKKKNEILPCNIYLQVPDGFGGAMLRVWLNDQWHFQIEVLHKRGLGELLSICTLNCKRNEDANNTLFFYGNLVSFAFLGGMGSVFYEIHKCCFGTQLRWTRISGITRSIHKLLVWFLNRGVNVHKGCSRRMLPNSQLPWRHHHWTRLLF